jgi:hypothetical protein
MSGFCRFGASALKLDRVVGFRRLAARPGPEGSPGPARVKVLFAGRDSEVFVGDDAEAILRYVAGLARPDPTGEGGAVFAGNDPPLGEAEGAEHGG